MASTTWRYLRNNRSKGLWMWNSYKFPLSNMQPVGHYNHMILQKYSVFSLRIISRSTIKPSSPTPNHLRKSYNLSLLDQLTPSMYVPMLLFYPNPGCDNSMTRLKNSLSKILTRYYPFAGRLVNGVSVDCNDKGVDFFEAQVGCTLSDILKKPDPRTLDLLYPRNVLWNEEYKGGLVVVQVTSFNCGGMAIATCVSHKVANGSTLTNFVNEWAIMARNCGEELTPLEFISSSILPVVDNSQSIPQGKLVRGVNCVTRRLVFDASKLAQLKAMCSGAHNPTRVDVVTALIYRCAMAASSSVKSDSSRVSILNQMVNLRPRVEPPMPKNSVGNFVCMVSIMAREKSDKNLHNLVGSLKQGMTQFHEKYAKNLTGKECYQVIRESINETSKVLNMSIDGVDVYLCTSICSYPFNQINFGWGKPIWVCFTSSGVVKNSFLFKDAIKEGGIEAWVTLEESNMAIFECDEELLAFASLNPSDIKLGHSVKKLAILA